MLSATVQVMPVWATAPDHPVSPVVLGPAVLAVAARTASAAVISRVPAVAIGVLSEAARADSMVPLRSTTAAKGYRVWALAGGRSVVDPSGAFAVAVDFVVAVAFAAAAAFVVAVAFVAAVVFAVAEVFAVVAEAAVGAERPVMTTIAGAP